jgi:hypothetical protein
MKKVHTNSIANFLFFLPTHHVSCVAKIFSDISDNEMNRTMKFIESRGIAKTVMELTSNLIEMKLKDECYIYRLTSLHNKASDNKMLGL